MSKTLTRDVGTRPLTLHAQVKDWAMAMRTEMATGTIVHEKKEYKIEVSTSMNGNAVLVSVSLPPKKGGPSQGWRTYALTSETLIRAVFEDYIEHSKLDPIKGYDE